MLVNISSTTAPMQGSRESIPTLSGTIRHMDELPKEYTSHAQDQMLSLLAEGVKELF